MLLTECLICSLCCHFTNKYIYIKKGNTTFDVRHPLVYTVSHIVFNVSMCPQCCSVSQWLMAGVMQPNNILMALQPDLGIFESAGV